MSKYIGLLVMQVLTSTLGGEANDHYGVDVSWPIHSYNVSTNYDWLPHNIANNNIPTPSEYQNLPIQPLGNRQNAYNEFMNGCIEKYNVAECMECEEGRISTNLERMKYMVNFTDIGFKKVKTPADVFKDVLQFWDDNVHKKELEFNDVGETTNNHWVSPAYMVDLENNNLRGGRALRSKIWESVEKDISEWVNVELKTSALYGIRMYTDGAILNSHVDDLPRICSAIINVAQDVDEDWPLEVIGHDGLAYNITMEPGDMILYESHSLIHGRPFELKGRFYANIFIHFEPKLASKDRPYYITDNVPKRIYSKWIEDASSEDSEDGSASAHDAANVGDLETLIEISTNDESMLSLTDNNGWSPLHEAIRGGHVDVIEFLLDHGADVDETTNAGDSAFDLASEHNTDPEEILEILERFSADHDEI